MGKIDEFEDKIIKQGMSDEDFEEYKKLLKRVRGNFGKRQHCYTTAIQFPTKNATQAIKLIEYGLETYPDEWFSTYTSYLYIGKIYESSRKYQKAYDSYLMAMNALGEMGKGYREELSGDLCWMRLHIDSFQYSEELEELYSCYDKTDEFSKGFINSEFRRMITQIVIALHHNKKAVAKEAYKQATAIYSPSYVGKIHNILARHNYMETLKITPESKRFLSELKI